MHIFLFLPFLIAICITSVAAVPHNGRRVVFSTDTSINYDEIKDSIKEDSPPPGTPEYYNAHRWITVDNFGYEHEGTLDEVMAVIRNEQPAKDEDYPMPDPSIENPTDPATPKAAVEDDLDGDIPLEKRSVINPDTRIKMVPNRFPFTAMGRVQIGCSGTFVAKRAVLTAGHCVYKIKTDKWYNNLNFQRGKDCDPNRGSTHTWRRAVSYVGWVTNHLIEYDIALIIVYQPTPVIMNFEYYPSLSGIINIVGYPGDKSGRCLWLSHCVLGQLLPKRLRYPCDTAGGMSGSAIYLYYPSIPKRVIVGVHAYGLFGTPRLNSGTRITQIYDTTLRKFINDYGGN